MKPSLVKRCWYMIREASIMIFEASIGLITFACQHEMMLRDWVGGGGFLVYKIYGGVYRALPQICTYRTSLYERDFRDVAFIVSSRFKIKALSLPSCFAPFDLGNRLAWEGLICMWASKQLCVYHVSETWFWLYVTFKTHFFQRYNMPISKDVWKRLCVYHLQKFAWKTFENADSRQKIGR